VVSANADVPAPYATIQAAYAAAKAAGHGVSNPAVVLIHPGLYVEPLLLDTPGIHLAGLTGSFLGVSISDRVTITAAGFVSIANLVMASLTVSGTTPNLYMDNVTIPHLAPGSAIEWSATAGSASLSNCMILALSAPAIDASTAVTMALTARDTSFNGPSDGLGMRLPDAPPSGQVLTNCYIIGSVEITAGASPSYERRFSSCGLDTRDASTPAIRTIGAGAQAMFVGGIVSCLHTVAAVGAGAETGTFRFIGTAFPGPRGASSVFGVALLATEAVYQRPWNVVADTNAALPVEARGVLTAAASGPTTILGLPDLLQFPDGEAIEIKRTAASFNTVTASAMGGQSVDGAASVTLTELTARGSITVRADRSGLNWRVVAVVGTFV
jgi:hypothetical protein